MIEELSESQRQCLRLVLQNKTSKEIAKETGLSPHTVDTYLLRAAATLGANNRREAARIFLELEQSERFGYEPPQLEITPANPETDDAPSQGVGRSRGNWLLNQFPAVGGQPHELTLSQIVLAVMKISIVSTGAVAALITIYIWINNLSLR